MLVAAYLLNFGRRALHEYGHKRNFDTGVLVKVLNEMVGVWVDHHGLDRKAVNEIVVSIDDHMVPIDFADTDSEPTPLT